jgi:hypothetical protein
MGTIVVLCGFFFVFFVLKKDLLTDFSLRLSVLAVQILPKNKNPQYHYWRFIIRHSLIRKFYGGPNEFEFELLGG